MVEAEHNYPAVAPEAFAANRKFSQADIAIIKNDIKAHITPIKTLGRLHDLNPGKYFTLRDLHNQRSQLRREKLAYLTPIQHLLQELQTDLWYKVCQALTLPEYEQARAELQIADPARIPDHQNSLFQYVDKEYLGNDNKQKHCYYWTNRITHFNKRVTSTAEGGHANVKKALESTLGHLP